MTKIILTKQEAKKLLFAWKTIHCFRNTCWMLIWFDWAREDVLNLIDQIDVCLEVGGNNCIKLWHWLCVYSPTDWYYFFETKPELVDRFLEID